MLFQLKASRRGDGSGEVKLKPWRIHDLRRTAATGMERLGVKQQVVAALLGHTAGSKAGITGIYQIKTYEEESATQLRGGRSMSPPSPARRSDIRGPEFLAN
jgi:integrase